MIHQWHTELTQQRVCQYAKVMQTTGRLVGSFAPGGPQVATAIAPALSQRRRQELCLDLAWWAVAQSAEVVARQSSGSP